MLAIGCKKKLRSSFMITLIRTQTIKSLSVLNIGQEYGYAIWKKWLGKLTYPKPREKPTFKHAVVLGLLALGVALFLASYHSWDLIGKTTTWALNVVGVRADYLSPLYLIYVKLMNGTVVGFQVLIECSGLVTVAVFSFIYTLTIGLLRGSILRKVSWLLLGVGVGFLWNINRLVLVIIIACNLGLSVFSFTHYLLGPFIDFLWVVTMWSLGMSRLKEVGNTS